MMTKKDFEAAAEWIRKEFCVDHQNQLFRETKEAKRCADLIIYLNNNSRFDKNRFLNACGLGN